MRRRLWLWLCLATLLAPALAPAAERFPSPDFESAYVIPTPTTPPARAAWRDYADIAALFLALSAASWLALRKRSRPAMTLLMLGSLAYFGFWREGCICPVGSLQNIVLAVTDSTYTVPLVVLAFFLLPLLFTLFFGRTFCAAVCPLGAMQDVVALRPVQVPRWADKGLGTLRYAYLGLTVLLVTTGAGFYICRFDPFVSFFRRSGSAEILTLGACFLAVGVFVARPYCRYLCPYGLVLSWLSRLSKWHATITPDECIHCRLCERACPFGAILKPAEARAPEPREKGVRRLALLLGAAPFVVAAGVWIGARLGAPLAQLHPDVRLAEQVSNEDAGRTTEPTVESDAFRSTGRGTADLYASAERLGRDFARGGGWMGGLLALAFSARLVALSVRRTRKDYVPDRGECLSCARCFEYCPKEQVRRRKIGKASAPSPSS